MCPNVNNINNDFLNIYFQVLRKDLCFRSKKERRKIKRNQREKIKD